IQPSPSPPVVDTSPKAAEEHLPRIDGPHRALFFQCPMLPQDSFQPPQIFADASVLLPACPECVRPGGGCVHKLRCASRALPAIASRCLANPAQPGGRSKATL